MAKQIDDQKVEKIAQNPATITDSKNFQDFSSKSLSELLTLRESLIILVEYYENYARANNGNYAFNAQELYAEARVLSEKYNKALLKVLNAIQNKVNESIFAS